MNPKPLPLVTFARSESGAVTVDWTVLAAAVVGLGLTSATAVRTGVASLGGDIDASLSGAGVAFIGTVDGSWEFTPLALSPEQIASQIDYFMNLTGYDDAGFNNFYRIYAERALGYLDGGNPARAAEEIDAAYAITQVLDRRGIAFDPTLPSLEYLTLRYQEALN